MPLGVDVAVRLFKGHSGCKVELWRGANGYFVRKWSASPSYNPRFQRQIDKQILLAKVIAVPRILQQSKADGLVVVDMEFVAGEDFRSFAPQQRIDAIVSLVDQIVTPLLLLQASGTGDVPPSEFVSKLAELRSSIPASHFYRPHQAYLTTLLDMLERLDWSGVPQSICHGDLTLENILIGEDGVVFIDPLDGAMNSVWLDIAKLAQDLDTGWSLRSILWHEEPTAEARLLRMLTRYLSEELMARLLVMVPAISGRLGQLRALQMLRVLPYITDQKTFSNVVDGLKSI